MSAIFSARAGSVERLKVRRRCGCSRLARQMRYGVQRQADRFGHPAAGLRGHLAGRSPGGSSKTLLTVSIGTGGLPGGRVLSCSGPATPASAY